MPRPVRGELLFRREKVAEIVRGNEIATEIVGISTADDGSAGDFRGCIAYGANIQTSRMILLSGNITDNLFVN